jgi:hypothetical protein
LTFEKMFLNFFLPPFLNGLIFNAAINIFKKISVP